jgi:regulator of protease activity HflC (stomatin/prohibitin superfamily)
MLPDDGVDSEAIQPNPTNSGWKQSLDDTSLIGAEALPAPSNQQQMQVFSGTALAREQASKQEDTLAPADDSDDLRKELWHAIRLIIIPLLFAGISCLLVLPSIAIGEAHFPPETLWSIGLIIIIVALLQGIAVHYSKPFPGTWILCTMGGFVVLLSISIFALFGPVPGVILVLILLFLTAYILQRTIHPVPEGAVDIVLAFGKYSRTLYPGFHLLFPWEKATHQVNVEETHWNCPPQKIQMSRDNDLMLRALISYQIIPEAAHLAVTQVKNWEERLRDTFIATLQTVATVFTPDDFLNWPQSLDVYQQQPHHPVSSSPADDFSESPERRESINDYLCQYIRAKTALWGIQINWVSIRDIELAPHSLNLDPIHHHFNEQQTTPSSTTLPEQIPQLAQIPKIAATEPQQQAVSAAVRQGEPAKPIEIPKEEILIKVYKEVQNGKVTDPEAIRTIAATFEAVAQDSQANQSVSFDAEQAAKILYKRARLYEELYANGR